MKKLIQLIKKLYYDKKIRFLFVGGLNTLIGYGTYALFTFFGWHYFLAQTFSTIIGVTNSYFWNKYFTFRKRERSFTEAAKFISVYLVSFFTSLLIQYILIDLNGVNQYIAGFVSLVTTTLLSWFGHNLFSFRRLKKLKKEKNNMRLSDFIADFLFNNGVSDVFTVTGGGAMFLNDSFAKKLNCIYNHHEQACSIAAEGYARVNNKMAAVCVTTGPGGTNALTGVLGSYLDSIPMIIISGQVKFSTTIKSTNIPLRQLGDQEFNITECVKGMTKYSYMVTDPNTIKYHLKKALYIANNGRKGPVWLDIPINIQSAKIDVDKLIDYDESEDNEQILLNEQNISSLISKLESSLKPVILAGEGIVLSNQRKEFIKLVNKLKIPVVTAWNNHDILDDNNAYYCGRPGTVGDRGGNFVLQNADFVLSLGCRMNIRQISYNYENFAKNAFLAAVDIDNNELNKPTLNIDLKINADLKDVLKALNKTEITIKNEVSDWLNYSKEVNKKYPVVLSEYYQKKSPINPYVFMKELSKRLNEGDVIVCSNGTACVCAFQAFEIKQNQRLFTNSGCASMGYGLPASIGASIYLKNQQRVICIEGDGSLQMNIQELQTIVHNKLKIKLIYLDNDGYHSIRQTQVNTFNSNFCGVDKNSGISFPDIEKIAYAYGIKHFLVDDLDSIEDRINAFLASDESAICQVVLDKTQFFAPKLSSKTLPDGSIISPSLEDMYPFLTEEEFKSASFKEFLQKKEI